MKKTAIILLALVLVTAFMGCARTADETGINPDGQNTLNQNKENGIQHTNPNEQPQEQIGMIDDSDSVEIGEMI